MKRILCIAFILLSFHAFAQNNGSVGGILNRFTDPDKGHTVFIEKGHRALGISGSYRSFSAAGDGAGGGYAILSFLNIGDGKLALYEATPSFSYFLADDLSLGVRLEYDGYTLDTDLRANLGELFNLSGVVEMLQSADDEEGASAEEDLYNLLNVRISGRHMVSNSWGGSLALRKYMSFFGSKTFGVFGEARLYGKYGHVTSCPITTEGYETAKMRTSNVYSAGLKFGAGLAVKLRDNSAITVSLPLAGLNYSFTRQHKETKTAPRDAHMSQFSISREIDFMAIQVGYTHYIKSKKK